MPQIALVRPPDHSFVTALGQKPDAPAIVMANAEAQHRSYVSALRDAGLEVVLLPPSAGLPDACFVQDVALVLPEGIILARLAEPARQGEVAAIRAYLPVDRPWVEIHPPGTLEWGDVLRIDDTFYAGQSARTNAAGTEQLRQALRVWGYDVEALPVPRGLHLLSGVNTLGRAPSTPNGQAVLVSWAAYANLPQFDGLDIIVVPEDEAPAANCLAIGESVIVPAGYPRTAAEIRRRGFRVLGVPVDEFAKADGGVTCLSIVW
jgi:dimethylargininase